jgi:hypothetical protein
VAAAAFASFAASRDDVTSRAPSPRGYPHRSRIASHVQLRSQTAARKLFDAGAEKTTASRNC